MRLTDIRFSDLGIVVSIPLPANTVRHFQDRPQCGLLFAKSGKLRYTQDNCAFLSDETCVLFVPRGTNYSLHSAEPSLSYVINFDMSNEWIAGNSIRSFQIGDNAGILSILSDMSRLWSANTAFYRTKCLSLAYELLFRMEKAPCDVIPKSAAERRIRNSLTYLEYHYLEPGITNDILAEQSGISTAYFRRLFHEVCGVSPIRCVQQKRIERAKALLQTGYLTISEIADAVGYSSLYHFSREFKLLVGVSPSRYMAALRRPKEE